MSGFTPQVRRATPGTAQQVAKDTASNGLEESRGHRAITFSSRQSRRGAQVQGSELGGGAGLASALNQDILWMTFTTRRD